MSNRAIEISTRVKLRTEECCNCGVLFAMPEDMYRRVKERGTTWYCPNGHPQHYTESDIQKLQSQLDTAKSDAEFFRVGRDGALEALDVANKETQRLKKRVHAGVCPHCNRHFVNVERHMKSKHPA